MSSLAEREKQLLLQLARRALAVAVSADAANKPPLQDFPNEEFLQQLSYIAEKTKQKFFSLYMKKLRSKLLK